MAHIEKIKTKGETYYRITVSSGFNRSGKRLRHRTVYHPDPGMSEAKAKKAAVEAAHEFERSLKLGYQPDTKYTFEQYADYVLTTKKDNGILRPTTIERYRSLLTRINEAIGHIRLTDLRAHHLNEFYSSLSKPGARMDELLAKTIVDLDALIRKLGYSYSSLAKQSGVGATTISSMCKRKTVSAEKAQIIADELNQPFNKLFQQLPSNGKLSKKTILEHHRLISAVLTQAEREMLVPYNAAEKVIPIKRKRPLPNYFQPDEIVAILEHLRSEPLQWQAIMHLFIITGCRRSEIAGLKWRKVNLDTGELIIDEGLHFTKEDGLHQTETKTGDIRYLHLPKETVQLLRQHRAAQIELRLRKGSQWQDTGYVFTRDNGLPIRPDVFTQWMDNFSKRYYLPHINPHAFRHSLASILLANGTDVVTVSKQLGHASVSTTENYYSHIIKGYMATATEKIADVLLRKAK